MSGPTLQRQEDGQPVYISGQGPVLIDVLPCFPWKYPGQYLALRDSDGNEVAFIEHLEELDDTSRQILEEELARNAQVFQVTSIQGVQKEIELRCWDVSTPGGDRSFQTELDEWPRDLPDGGHLVQDLFGDLYRLPPLSELDPVSRRLLEPLLS